jgi:hypothetical protein
MFKEASLFFSFDGLLLVLLQVSRCTLFNAGLLVPSVDGLTVCLYD